MVEEGQDWPQVGPEAMAALMAAVSSVMPLPWGEGFELVIAGLGDWRWGMGKGDPLLKRTYCAEGFDITKDLVAGWAKGGDALVGDVLVPVR